MSRAGRGGACDAHARIWAAVADGLAGDGVPTTLRVVVRVEEGSRWKSTKLGELGLLEEIDEIGRNWAPNQDQGSDNV